MLALQLHRQTPAAASPLHFVELAVAINAIHLDRIPEFSYDLLWLERGLRSVANFTRTDAREFRELAASIPIRTAIQTFPLAHGNEALRRLASGDLEATAVLVVGERDPSGASTRSE